MSQIIVNQGEIYWLSNEESPIPHPHLVLQENHFNHSRLETVIVCSLTTNLKRASYLGNVLLEPNEGNLPKQSVVEVSKLSSVKKSDLGDYIGSLSAKRLEQILAALRFLQQSYFTR